MTEYTAVIRISIQGESLTAEYGGGAYIDILDYDGNAVDVINVYDYEAGRPKIDFTPAAVADKVAEYLAEWAR